MTIETNLQQSILLEIEQALHQAITQHQAGQLQLAKDLYLAILGIDPNQPDANHNLGILLIQTGSPEAALPSFLNALNARPEQRQYWISYIDALIQSGRHDEAEQLLTLARQQGLEGDDVEALAVQSKPSPDIPAKTVIKPKKTNSKAAGNIKKHPSIQQINTLAQLYNKGKYTETLTLARQMTERYPLDAYGWKALGAVYKQTGQNTEAVIAMQRAVELLPSDTESLNNLANTLQHMGHMEEAATLYQRVITSKPDNADAYCNLGVTLRQLGRLNEAEASYRSALKIKPGFAEAYSNLGNTLKDLGRLVEAEDCYRQALKIKPDYAAAHNNLGATLKEFNQLEDAILCFRRALKINPVYAEAHNNLGNALREIGQFDEAISSCRRALELKPDYAEAHSNLGGVLKELGQLDQSLESCQRALAINPGLAVAHNNLGNTLQSQGHAIQAQASYHNALTLQPDYAMARYNLGYSQLSCGQLSDGWVNHEFRTCINRNRFPLTPYWSGENLSNKSILIWGEQGIGDEIMFASMYAEITRQAERCIIECAPKLLSLFSRSFPDAQLIPKSESLLTDEKIDYHCAAGSLAQWLRPDLASFPCQRTYLVPDQARVDYWKLRLDQLGPEPKIGFCWRSSMKKGERDLHYTTLDHWGPIFSTPGVHFINLQYDECSAELNEARTQFGVTLHEFTEIDMYNDLDETAALIQALKLVISAPTAVATISAALGIDTWVMSYGATWEVHGTNHTPWFPTMKYFNRPWDQAWNETIKQVSELLPSVQ